MVVADRGRWSSSPPAPRPTPCCSNQPDQAAEAALQRRCCATTSASPRSSSAATTRPRSCASTAARTRSRGDYFGPFACAGAVNRDAEHPAEGLPAALLLGQRLRDPHAALHAAPDQALLGALRRPDQPGGLRQAGRARPRLPARQEPGGDRPSCATRCRRPPTDWSSSAPPRLRDRIRAAGRIIQAHQDQPRDGRRGRRLRPHAEGGQACVQVFFFRAGQNWGNRAYFPRVDKSRRRRRDPRRLPRPVLRRQADPAADPALRRARRSASCWPRPSAVKAGRKVEIAGPQRGEKRELVEHALTNAREALGRKMAESSAQAKLLAGVCERFGLDGPPRADRGLRQLPHHGHQRGRRHDRRRARGLPEEPVPQVQHQERRPHARRRLRHDARGAAPPLRPPGQGGGRAARRRHLARPGADRRRRRPAGRGAGGAWPTSASTTSPWWASPRARTATPGWSASSCRAGAASCSSRKTRCSTTCSACATRPTASPSAPTAQAGPAPIGRSVARRDRGRRRARKRALLHAFGSAKGVQQAGLADLERVPGINEAVARTIHDYFHDGG